MTAAYDEMNGHDGQVRPVYGGLDAWLRNLPADVLERRRR
jgi:uncharacterized circularly permuted ATP-grasp superfamily protein